MDNTQLSTEPRTLAVQEPSVAQMLQGALDTVRSGEVTPQHVEVLSKMMELYERQDRRQGERDFAEALAALQSETIRVVATKKVDEKPDGSCRYRFAPYEEIMAKCQPILSKHGFSVTFDTETGDARLTSICTLTHKGGHSRANKFAVRYGKPPGSSDAQGDMSTKSYAKRGALCDALNIAIDHDDDARAIGDFITAEKATELKARAQSCGADMRAFLEFAGAETFETIGTEAVARLEAKLSKKEKTKPDTSLAKDDLFK